ncbi:MAG: GNAT family N-acetyltransferase [Burkholderiales bacterium]|nr:GNAT family N-acetyltransferase [Burkholderiales bacterium]
MPMRKWRPQDLDATIDTFRRAVHELAAGDYTPEELEAWAPRECDRSAWERRMEGSRGWIFEINGKLGGFITSDAPGHIDLLYVHPDYKRMGVATALLELLVADAGARGITALRTEASRSAKPFFEQAGFSVLRTERVMRDGVALERFVMERAG